MEQNRSGDPARMARGASQVEAHSQLIHEIQLGLDTQIRQLLATWHGGTATSFLRAYEGFYDKFRIVNHQLDRIHGELAPTQHEHAGRERADA